MALDEPLQAKTDLKKESSLGQSPQNLQCGWMDWIMTTLDPKASTEEDTCRLGLRAVFPQARLVTQQQGCVRVGQLQRTHAKSPAPGPVPVTAGQPAA